jgi:hypothetical protein
MCIKYAFDMSAPRSGAGRLVLHNSVKPTNKRTLLKIGWANQVRRYDHRPSFRCADYSCAAFNLSCMWISNEQLVVIKGRVHQVCEKARFCHLAGQHTEMLEAGSKSPVQCEHVFKAGKQVKQVRVPWCSRAMTQSNEMILWLITAYRLEETCTAFAALSWN